MIETTPIFDEIHKFMEATKAEVPKIQKALHEVGRAFEGWHVHIEEWGRQFAQNNRSIGIEAPSWVDLELQRRRDKRLKEQENCLHGRTKFRITWAVSMKCPRCYSDQVFVGSERLWCLLCDWKQWRIGKRPRVRFTNG